MDIDEAHNIDDIDNQDEGEAMDIDDVAESGAAGSSNVFGDPSKYIVMNECD